MNPKQLAIDLIDQIKVLLSLTDRGNSFIVASIYEALTSISSADMKAVGAESPKMKQLMDLLLNGGLSPKATDEDVIMKVQEILEISMEAPAAEKATTAPAPETGTKVWKITHVAFNEGSRKLIPHERFVLGRTEQEARARFSVVQLAKQAYPNLWQPPTAVELLADVI